MAQIEVKGTAINIYSKNAMDFISLTDMLKAKDGDFSYQTGYATAIPWSF